MRRSILTGILAFALTSGSFAVALADEPPVTPTVAAESVAGPASADPNAPVEEAPAKAASADDAGVAAAQTAAADTAAPTAGADLSMWNAAVPASDTPAAEPPVTDSAKHVSRLRRFASGIISRSSAIASSLTRSAMRFLGTPYVFGGSRPGGFDCSGYVQHVFAMIGLHLPRTADAQYDAGRRIAAAMAPGDLVFFHTYAPGVSHVGIYLGNDKFIHSSSSHGVSIASLHDSYWAPRYLGAKRVVGR